MSCSLKTILETSAKQSSANCTVKLKGNLTTYILASTALWTHCMPMMLDCRKKGANSKLNCSVTVQLILSINYFELRFEGYQAFISFSFKEASEFIFSAVKRC